MCGFVVGETIKDDTDKFFNVIKKSSLLIANRGPDDNGWFDCFKEKDSLKKKFAGIHYRLSVIGRNDNKSYQPLRFEDKIIFYNGEIYNFLEIRIILQKKGYNFDSNCDTEVILKAFHEFGNKAFSLLDGMWAIVIYDLKKDIIIASRDQFGIKPLYYSIDPHKSLFLYSELKVACGLFPFIKTKVNFAQLDSFVMNKNIDGDSSTFLEDCFQIKPGEILIFSNACILKKERLSIYPNNNFSKNPKKNMGLIDVIQDSVDKRLISDIPVVLNQSGGIDSSIIHFHISKKVKYNIYSYVDKNKPDKQEIEGISKINSFFKKSYKKISPNYCEIFDDWSDHIFAMDGPTRSLTSHILSNIYKSIKSNEKKSVVVLNGQGADEIFGGYASFIPILIVESFRKLDFIYLYSIFNYIFKIRKDFKLKEKIVIILKSLFKLLNFRKRNFIRNYVKYNLVKGPLQEYLRYEDRASSRYGLEARLPFLSKGIIKNIIKMNYKDYFSTKFYQKSYLRNSYMSLLPEEIVFQKIKKGFTVPDWDKFPIEFKELILKRSDQYKEISKINSSNIRSKSKRWRSATAMEWVLRINESIESFRNT